MSILIYNNLIIQEAIVNIKNIMPGVSILFLTLSAVAAEHENLLENGSFDKGGKTPDNWESANGLTSFYVKEEGRGRIVKMDSRISRKEALDWMKQFKSDPNATPPEPVIPKNDFDSIASNEGAWLDSGFINVKPGQNYRLSVDFKGPASPFVWIKGFMFHPVRKDYVDAYQTRLVPENPDKEKWKTFSIGFNPTGRTPKVEKMKVRIYAYWPPGIYYFDNVRVEEITPEEMADLLKKRALTPEKEMNKEE